MNADNPVRLPMPPGAITGPSAWYGPELAARTDWIYQLTADDLAELDAAIGSVKHSGLALGDISAQTFALPRLGAALKGILQELLNGRGFVLVRGFPVEKYSIEEAAIGYLGLGSHFGTFRSQNAKGHLLGHVKDLGFDIKQPTVRYYQTNRELEYHTDSCDMVGLLCLQPSRAGGESKIVSSVTIYNEILRQRPDLLPWLFQPVPTDRRGEVPPGMKPWFEIPVFNWHDGRLSTIYAGQYVRSSQQNCPEARRLAPEEHAAIDLVDRLANDPRLNLQMEFRRGDMQFLHNHQILHSRTDFEDWPEPERRRHLLRLWLAPKSARKLPESYAQRYGSTEPGNRGGIVVKETKLKFVLAAE